MLWSVFAQVGFEPMSLSGRVPGAVFVRLGCPTDPVGGFETREKGTREGLKRCSSFPFWEAFRTFSS